MLSVRYIQINITSNLIGLSLEQNMLPPHSLFMSIYHVHVTMPLGNISNYTDTRNEHLPYQ